jgi:hypothetical protein
MNELCCFHLPCHLTPWSAPMLNLDLFSSSSKPRRQVQTLQIYLVEPKSLEFGNTLLIRLSFSYSCGSHWKRFGSNRRGERIGVTR